MIFSYLSRRCRLLLVPVVLFIVAQVYLDLRIPEYMDELTYILQVGTDPSTATGYGFEMLGCALLSLLMSLCAGGLIAYIAVTHSHDMRNMLFDHIQTFSPADFNRFSVASLITRSTGDIKQIQNFVGTSLQTLIKSPILAVWAITKISVGDWHWTLATALCVVFMVGLILLITLLSFKYFGRAKILTDSVNHETRESVLGARVVRAYNAEHFQEEKFDRASDDLLDCYMALFRIRFALFTLPPVVTNFLTIAVYWIGALLITSTGAVDSQMLYYSHMIMISSYAIQVLNAFVMMTDFIRNYPDTAVCLRRVEEVLKYKPTIVFGKDRSENVTETGTIEFRDVGFTYPGGRKPVLENISFKVGKGDTFAIVGSTGSGKSTLVKLMQRFYDPDNGSISVDGVDIKDFSRDSINARMAYVPQEAVIFSGTVRDNVNFGEGSEKRTDDDVWEALRIAQSEDFVKAKGGLDADTEQLGKNLSGGQKQRLSIARAVCRDPEFYILDDTFSALDMKTDRDLRAALKAKTGHSTKVIVAQRISTVVDADLILVLDEGRMVGLGKHYDLLETCPVYREIASSQMAEGTV